jgi:hypothetical protein
MTDFIEWLGGNEPDDFEDVYCLYLAATGGGNCGTYQGSRDDRGRVFIKGSQGESLALISEAAKKSFLRLIRRRYMDGDDAESMDPESWYMFMHAMSKEP